MFHHDSSDVLSASAILNNKLSVQLVNNFSNSFATTISLNTWNNEIILSNFFIRPKGLKDVHIDFISSLLNFYKNQPLVICGDFNARSPVWFDKITNGNGFYFQEILNQFDLLIHNNRA